MDATSQLRQALEALLERAAALCDRIQEAPQEVESWREALTALARALDGARGTLQKFGADHAIGAALHTLVEVAQALCDGIEKAPHSDRWRGHFGLLVNYGGLDAAREVLSAHTGAPPTA